MVQVAVLPAVVLHAPTAKAATQVVALSAEAQLAVAVAVEAAPQSTALRLSALQYILSDAQSRAPDLCRASPLHRPAARVPEFTVP